MKTADQLLPELSDNEFEELYHNFAHSDFLSDDSKEDLLIERQRREEENITNKCGGEDRADWLDR